MRKNGFDFEWAKPQIIDMPQGLIPSMFMDFLSLNPFNLLAVMVYTNGLGLRSLQCDDGRKSMCGIEEFNGDNGISDIDIRYINKFERVKKNKYLYILFWFFIILIISYLVKLSNVR